VSNGEPPFEDRYGVDLGEAGYLYTFTRGGYIWGHSRPDNFGPPCEGWVNPSVHKITYATEDQPATITPSLHCARCSRHGWVVDGQWRPA